MGELEHSVLYVTFSYEDGSELIFKGTRDVSFIASCSPAFMSRDCFTTEEKTELKPGIIYDLKILGFYCYAINDCVRMKGETIWIEK